MSNETKNMKVPKLRFTEFKESIAWEEKPFGEICKFIRGPFGGALKKEIFVKSGYAVYEQSHAIYNNFDSFRYFITEEKFNELKRFEVLPNDIIMSCSGTMGKFSIVPIGSKKGVINQALLKLTVKIGNDLRFIKETLELPINQEKLLSQSAGGAIKNVVEVSQIKEIVLNIPLLKEQQKIADCLSSLDDLITAESQKLNALKDHKKGMMQQLFPAEGEVLPKLRFGEFRESGEWEEKTLEKLTTKIGDGIHTTPNYDETGEYIFINGNNLSDGIIYSDSKTKRVSKDEYIKYKKELNENTILLSINGTIGNIAFYRGESVILGKSACYLNTSNELNKIFLYYLLQSDKVINYFDSELTGSTIKNLSLQSIREAIVIVPSSAEQQRIAYCLSSLDDFITGQIEKVETLKVHKKGLMQGLFPQMGN